LGFFYPNAVPCQDLPPYINPYMNMSIYNVSEIPEELRAAKWLCPEGQYNDMALLTFNSGHNIIRILLEHDNINFFTYKTLFAFLAYYFLFAAWSAGGIAVACGFVVPMLTVGALYGRILGKVMIEITPCQ